MSLIPFTWALRDTMGGKRALGMLALALIPGLLVGILVLIDPGRGVLEIRDDTVGVIVTIVLPVTVGLIALVASGPVLRTPLREGTILYLLTRPVRRTSLGAQRAMAAAICTAVLAALTLVPVGLFMGQWDLIVDALPGVVLGGLTFGALYGLLVSLHRYALGIAVVHLVAETAVAHLPFRIHEATITWHLWGLMGEVATLGESFDAVPAGGGGWLVPVAVLVVSILATAGLYRWRDLSLNVADA